MAAPGTMRVIHLLLLIASTHGTALNPSSANAEPALSAGNNSIADGAAAAVLNATTSSLKMRASTTSIAGLTALWTAVTYFYIIHHGSSLAQGLALPRRSFERSLTALLGSAWVPHLVSPLDPSDKTRIKIVWLRTMEQVKSMERIGGSLQNARFALGYGEPQVPLLVPREQQQRPRHQGRTTKSTGQVWFHTASPAMKNLIMAAMWQYWSLWMTAGMVVLTAIYNGFLFDKPGPDAVVRLILVFMYAGTNVAYSIVFYRYFWQILDAVGNQACWVDISKTFAFFSPANHKDALLKLYDITGGTTEHKYTFYWHGEKSLFLRQFTCELLGGIATSELYQSRPGWYRLHWSGGRPEFRVGEPPGRVDFLDGRNNPSRFEKTAGELKKTAEEQLKLMIDAEVKALEKAAESGLEKLLANIIVILGICLSTGLAPWTTIRSQDSVATQIGSYAIILSVSTGVGALIASLTNMSNLADSATVLGRFQHYILGLPKAEYEAGITARHARFGIPDSPDPNIPGIVTLRDLYAGTTSKRRRLLWLAWGPAMGLMPHNTGDGLAITSLLKLPLLLGRWVASSILDVLRRGRPGRLEQRRRAGEENLTLLRDYRVDQAASHADHMQPRQDDPSAAQDTVPGPATQGADSHAPRAASNQH